MKRLDELYDVKLKDPYLDLKQYKDPTICPSCNLIYHNKRWFFDDVEYKFLVKNNNVTYKKCPACRKIEDNYPLALLEIYKSKLSDIELRDLQNLIKNEVKNEEGKNPLSRLIKVKEDGDKLIITTTTEFLGKKIAKAIDKTFHGNLHFSFSNGEKFIRISWTRS